MGIIKEFDKGSMDALRSLKNSDSGTKDSYIDKKQGFQYNQINTRITDLERFSKLLTDKPGLKFQGNMALAQQVDTLSDLKKAAKKPGGGFNFKGLVKEVGKKAVKTAVNNLTATASILAQIPVNGTGTHFIRGLTPSGYVQSGAPRTTGLGRFLSDIGVGGGVNGAKSALNGDPIGPTSGPLNADTVQSETPWNDSELAGPDKRSSFVKPQESSQDKAKSLKDRLAASVPTPNLPFGSIGNFLKKGEGNTNQDVPIDVEDKSKEKLEGTELTKDFTEPETHLKKLGSDDPLIGSQIVKTVQKARETDPNRKAKIVFDNLNQRELSQFQISEEQDAALRDRPSVHSMDTVQKYQLRDGETYLQSPLYIQNRYSLGDQGSRTNSGPDLVNQAIEQATVETLGADLVPFWFNILSPTYQSENPTNNFIQFRALLEGLDDNFNGKWNSTQYIGRAEEFFTYGGFSRQVKFSFKLAAFSRAELVPLYRKLNLLAGSTAPTYKSDGSFMRGTLVAVKVGDYLDNVTGIINSVSITWDKDYQWEIDAENLGNQKLPHILDISVDFTPIHDFEAKANINLEEEVYIGRKQLPATTDPDPQPEPTGETYEFYSSKGTYTIDKATNKVVAVNGQPTNYVNGGFAYKANSQQAEITRVNGVDSEL